jgi:CubicO group peptidase (beta-lactamase class C family)
MAAAATAPPNLAAMLPSWGTDPHPDLKAILIQQNGTLIAERYYNGQTPDAPHDIRSAAKSITSLLIGIAIDRQKIHHITDRVDQYLPQLAHTPVAQTTIADLLTMRSGLAANDEDPNSPGNEDNLDAAPDPIKFLAAIPRATPPGAAYVYNSLTAYTAGLVLQQATAQSAAVFAKQNLFAPLGIENATWRTDVLGNNTGQGNLSLTPRAMLQLGQLVLDQGRHANAQLISRGWITESLVPRVQIANVDPYADAYGYFWYTKTQTINGAPLTVHFASGNGGNKIYIIPARQMVIAIASSAYNHGYGQRRSQSILQTLLSDQAK